MDSKSTKRVILGAVLPLGIAGCLVGPNYAPPQRKMPAAFSATQPATKPSATSPAVSLERWWESFQDPQLNSLISRAVRTNLDLRIAASRVREARSQLRIQNAGLFPTANSSAGYNRFRFSKEGFYIPGSAAGGRPTLSGNGTPPSGSGTLNHVNPAIRRDVTGGSSTNSQSSGLASAFTHTEIDTFTGGFDASWEIDVFGGVRRSVEAAGADEEASIENHRDTMVSLLAEVARNYIELRGYQREKAIIEKNIKSQKETVDLTTSRFKAGLTTDLDVARAEAQVATTRATLPQLRTQIQQATHRIAVLLAQDPTSLEAELSRETPTIPSGPPIVPVGIPSELLRRRPDIRRAERQLAAANARIGAATADLFPRFSLTGSLGLASGTFKALGRLDSVYYSVGPSISWPIFDAGRIRANINVQNERELQAADQYEAAVLTSLEDVENALIAYAEERNRWVDLRTAVAANQRAFDLADQLYQKGLADFLSVLDVQRNLFASEDQLAQSERNVSADVVALYKALGGGWETFEGEQESDNSVGAATRPVPGK